MTKVEIVEALKIILDDSPIQRDKVLALKACLEPKPKAVGRKPRKPKGSPAENSLMGWLDIIRDS